MTSYAVQDISAPTALSNSSTSQASSAANNNNNDANTLSILVKCERNLVNSTTSDSNRLNNEESNYIDSKSNSNGSILFL